MYLYTFRNLERVAVVGAAAATAAVFTEKLRTVVCSKCIFLLGHIALHMGAYRQNKNSQGELLVNLDLDCPT